MTWLLVASIIVLIAAAATLIGSLRLLRTADLRLDEAERMLGTARAVLRQARGED